MQTMTLQRSSAPVLVGGARGAALVTLKVLAAVAVTALVVGVIVFARNEHTTAVDADIGTTWLSAESGGRIALVAPRAARPSLSTQLVDDEAAYDLAAANYDPKAVNRVILVTDGEHPYLGKWWVPGLTIGYEHSFVHAVADFIEGLSTGKPTSPTFRDALETTKVCDAILKSGKSGRWVSIS